MNQLEPERAEAAGGLPSVSSAAFGLASFRGSAKGAQLGRFAVFMAFGLACAAGWAQPFVPLEAVQQLQSAVGDRVEAVSILAGDYSAAGGLYTFRGGTLANVSISKLGGGGEVAAPRALGVGGLQWAPVLLGNVGYVDAKNEFRTGFLAGNEMTYHTLALAGGGGAAFYLTDHLSLVPTLSGMYGHVENEFHPQNAKGNLVSQAGSGVLVDWTMQTWSVVPGLELDYTWQWQRAAFEFSSRASFFHTESFQSTTPILGVSGDSTTWANKLEVDVPLGVKVASRELHAGGFFSRTDIFGGAANGLNTSYVYTVNTRVTLDVLGKLWVVRWLGVGASYFWGQNMGGWSVGLDVRLKL